jgi:glutaredoxin
MTAPEVTVYYKPGCPFAAKLRAKLTISRIPHNAVRFQDDPAATGEVRNVSDGNEISPTVRVGNRLLANPSLRQIRDARSVA